jgi:hypothetical protein
MPLWETMQTLTEEGLHASLGQWIGRGEIRAMLERRKRMHRLFDELIAKKGSAAIIR